MCFIYFFTIKLEGTAPANRPLGHLSG